MKFSAISSLGLMLLLAVFMAASVNGKPKTYLIETTDNDDKAVRPRSISDGEQVVLAL